MEEAIATLRGPAARLLLVILLAQSKGKRRMRAGEMKRQAGLSDWTQWQAAIIPLNETGLACIRKVPGSHEYEFTSSLISPASARSEERLIDRDRRMIDNLSIYRTSDAEAAEHDEPDLLEFGLLGNVVQIPLEKKVVVKTPNSGEAVQNLVAKVPNSENMVGKPLDIFEWEKDLKNIQVAKVPDIRSECVQVDLLDDSGDLARSNSPAQSRRRAQIAVVQKAWVKFFPTSTLLADNAKFFISHLSNSAEAVYDYFEWLESLHKDNPLAYGRKVLENRAREGVAAPSSPAPAPAYVPGPEPETPFDQAEADRVERAAHRARVALWQRRHPGEPTPEDL